jgi:hypothetical protein
MDFLLALLKLSYDCTLVYKVSMRLSSFFPLVPFPSLLHPWRLDLQLLQLPLASFLLSK